MTRVDDMRSYLEPAKPGSEIRSVTLFLESSTKNAKIPPEPETVGTNSVNPAGMEKVGMCKARG
jgi:hypothetical protein